ncbi:MAG: response regulator [Isosphaeraceae bacterium]|nr:response regulator [Isosphaeraceae bacterium]
MGTVLIVDDSPSDRALFRTILSRAGYTVQEVSRGRDALARARALRPHALILDVNLPDLDGHSVCRLVRAEPELAGLPVLMLTVRDNDADVLAGLEAGADDYVAKDSAPEIVLARVRRLIQYRQLATMALLNEQLVQVGRLLAGIVHEIRGPLAVIRGSAELMRLQLSEGDPHHQWVDPILRNAQLLQVRLEHLMATVRSGPSQVRTLELDPLIRETTDLFLKGTDPRAGQVKIEAGTCPQVQVNADAGRLMQVLLSLLGNAHEAILSAHPGGGRIAVQTRRTQTEGRDWAVIDITDNGPGVPEEFMERIFEPFFTTKESGTGYGLYMASEILREQGGRLSVRNSPEGGACFSVWLPQTVEPVSAGAA